jgi:hypothetical protein
MRGRIMFLTSALVAISLAGSAHAAGDAAGSMDLTGSTAAVNAAAPQEPRASYQRASYACSFVYGSKTPCESTIEVESGEHLYARAPVLTWKSASKAERLKDHVSVNVCTPGALFISTESN